MVVELKFDDNIFTETNVSSPEYDGVVLVIYPDSKHVRLPKHLDSFIDKIALLDKNIWREPSLWNCDYVSGQRLVLSPTGPITPYDDSRIIYDAAKNGIVRALKAGIKKPLLVIQDVVDFPESRLVLILGALEALSVPLQVRESDPVKSIKFRRLGISSDDNKEQLDKVVRSAIALERARIVARDIAGGDPERMSAANIAEYVKNVFDHDKNVNVSIIDDLAVIEKEYPLLAAVNRAASVSERHRPRVVEIEYKPSSSRITETLLLVGKGITYDTGGADIKTDGMMAGMSRDKSGAAAVAGFLKACSILKPPHLKVIGVLCLARNSVGEESYVADELLLSRSGLRVRVGNTDAEGRLAMADAVYHMSLRAADELNPHIYTIATLTGHARRTYGAGYTVAMDNYSARATKHSIRLEMSGSKIADAVETSSIKPEDFKANKGLLEGDDVMQFDNTHRVGKGCRGHQVGAAFLIVVGGLEDKNIKYTHLDIAGSAGAPPSAPTAAPILALSHLHKVLL